MTIIDQFKYLSETGVKKYVIYLCLEAHQNKKEYSFLPPIPRSKQANIS